MLQCFLVIKEESEFLSRKYVLITVSLYVVYYSVAFCSSWILSYARGLNFSVYSVSRELDCLIYCPKIGGKFVLLTN